MLYVLPLEPLEERYTGQWYQWYKRGLNDAGVKFEYIDGDQLTQTVETGVVLDAEGTNFWKFTQLQKVCQLFKEKRVKNGDVFYTMDLWHPGLESIPYMATLENIKVGMYGFLHAGSYVDGDFVEPMAPWAQYFERGWSILCDGVFVGSEFHKKIFTQRRLDFVTSCFVKFHIGFPYYYDEILPNSDILVPVEKRANIIIFPHRWDKEKRPDVFLELMKGLYDIRQDFEIWITTGRKNFGGNSPRLTQMAYEYKEFLPITIFENVNKENYHRLLPQAKIMVSTTQWENFGLSLLESMIMGCMPIVENAFSQPEVLYPGVPVPNNSPFLYNKGDNIVEKINYALDHPVTTSREYHKVHSKSIERMVDVMKSDGYLNE